MADTRGILKSTRYDEAYYREHVAAGLDYLVSGDWHVNYAKMIAAATLQTTYTAPFVIDAGCACGAQLLGFKKLGIFKHVLGIDMSEDMIWLGRRHFGFSAEELVTGSVDTIPAADDTVTLINSGQVLEHVSDEIIDRVLAEFYRVLAPGGRMFHNLAALKNGDPPDHHDGDPTHINVKPTLYWSAKFQQAGFIADFESYDRFALSSESPGGNYPSFFQTYAPLWTSLAHIKPAINSGL